MRPSRPPPLDGFIPPRPQSFRRGKDWRRYVPDVVERVRVLVEGTTWPEAAIAARTGVGVATVNDWKTRRGWRRPADASLSTRKVGLSRAGFTRRCREALGQIEWLAADEAERLAGADPFDAAALRRAKALSEAARSARHPARRRRGFDAP